MNNGIGLTPVNRNDLGNGVTYGGPRANMISCSKCENTFFSSITINTFKDVATDLFNKPAAMNPTDHITILECVGCGHQRLPVLSYGYNNAGDLKLAKYLQELLDKRNARYEATNEATTTEES